VSSSGAADWVDWHRQYDDPTSPLARRLRVVQEHVRLAVESKGGTVRLISMCAGEGRDVAGALAGHPRRADVTGRLVELDERNAEVAREAIRSAGLDHVEVITADAALTDSYEGGVPGDIVLACGIFGNVSDNDVRRTVEQLPSLCAEDAIVVWTRGREAERDFALTIREWFGERGFEEVAYVAPDDVHIRVGVNRLIAPPQRFERGVRLFEFLR
jgi:hypothetical protein